MLFPQPFSLYLMTMIAFSRYSCSVIGCLLCSNLFAKFMCQPVLSMNIHLSDPGANLHTCMISGFVPSQLFWGQDLR